MGDLAPHAAYLPGGGSSFHRVLAWATTADHAFWDLPCLRAALRGTQPSVPHLGGRPTTERAFFSSKSHTTYHFSPY